MSEREAALARQKLAQAIRLVAEGDEAAMRFVYRATSAKLFGICARILGDTKDAEDALQEVYCDLWKSADRFDPARASPISWLATMARNRAVDRLRSGGKVRDRSVGIEAALEVADAGPLADSIIETLQRDARLHSCLEELDESQRRAIRAAFFQGLTYAQLADAQGVPLGTMKSWIRRGLARLKGCVERP